MKIKQGEIYWVDLGIPEGSEPGYKRPFLIIQNNIFNESKINTVIICALTSNLKRAKSPGNVLLKKKNANLSKDSVINISQILTIDKSDLLEKIGTISEKKLNEVLDGLKLIFDKK